MGRHAAGAAARLVVHGRSRWALHFANEQPWMEGCRGLWPRSGGINLARHVKIHVRKDRGLLHQENQGHDGNPLGASRLRRRWDPMRQRFIAVALCCVGGRREGILLLSREILRRAHRMLLSVEVSVAGDRAGRVPSADTELPLSDGRGQGEEGQQLWLRWWCRECSAS